MLLKNIKTYATIKSTNLIAKEKYCKMKEYKLVHLNKHMKILRENDLEQAQGVINEYTANGWVLQQIVSPNDLMGAMVGVFYKEH